MKFCETCGKRIVKIKKYESGWVDEPCHKGYRLARQTLVYEDEL